MKEIIHIVMGSAAENTDNTFEISGKLIRIKKLGVDFNIDLIKEIIKYYKQSVDVITISGLPNPIEIAGIEYTIPFLDELKDLAYPTPLMDGTIVRKTLAPWAINHFVKDDPTLIKNKKIGFFFGFANHYIYDELKAHDARFYFADIYFLTGLPILLKSIKLLEQFIVRTIKIFGKKPVNQFKNCDFNKPILKKTPRFKEFFDCDLYFLTSSQLDYINLPDLEGKSVIIESVTPKMKEMLKSKNVGRIYQCSADFHEEHFHAYTYLEGLFQALKDEGTPLTEDEVISYIEKVGIKPKTTVLNEKIDSGTNKFAFIIHPLSSHDLLKIPGLKKINNSKLLASSLEKISCYLPSFHYGQIKGIRSEHNGQTAIGDIYAVTETPQMMMKKNKSKMYQKLINVTHKADLKGNKIIGLGAYTKVFGDAGVTINRYSPIPVTTGNSLSAAATLWAANYAIDKMKFLKKKDGMYQGTVMIIGATGSIGKVNSKVLCKNWQRVILVAPKAYKLIDLKEELVEINPGCDVIFTTNPNEYTAQSDLIITTTSAQGKKILEIQTVKPGCVICDVSRPFDISQEDARSRPDVLVIASGEVELPGDVELKIDIGLSGNTVYACLAETALLAMEGRFESFSMSREISYQNVYEIDRLARKHGIKLSAIMGHKIEITDEEIELCRQHALANTRSMSNKVSHDINELPR